MAGALPSQLSFEPRAFTRLNKRSSFLGVPVAFLQQLGTCGRCTICETFAKVKGLWTKLKSAAKRVVNGMRRAKEHLFGRPADVVCGSAQVLPMPPRR